MFSDLCVFFYVFFIFVGFTNAHEGESCVLEGVWSQGVCTPYDSCVSARAVAGRGVLPKLCSYDQVRNPLVCCFGLTCPSLPHGTVNIKKTGIKAVDYCVGLADLAYPCVETGEGWSRDDMCPTDPSRKPADGQISKGDFAHLALLGFGDFESTKWYATGALISDRWVISEAYALLVHEGGAKRVRLGGLDLDVHVDKENIYNIAFVKTHPDYISPRPYNNIGLAKLDRVVVLSKLIFPVCLHVQSGSPLPSNNLTYLYRDGLLYQKANVKVLPHAECDTIYRPTFKDGIRVDTQLCVQRSNSESLKDGSGSPLQVPNGGQVACTQLLVAIHNFHQESTGRYALTARVAPFIPWIESQVWP